jgi:hypothetical protein
LVVDFLFFSGGAFLALLFVVDFFFVVVLVFLAVSALGADLELSLTSFVFFFVLFLFKFVDQSLSFGNLSASWCFSILLLF